MVKPFLKEETPLPVVLDVNVIVVIAIGDYITVVDVVVTGISVVIVISLYNIIIIIRI